MEALESWFESFPEFITAIIILVKLRRYTEISTLISAFFSVTTLFYGIFSYDASRNDDSTTLDFLYSGITDMIFRLILFPILFLSPIHYLTFLFPVIYFIILTIYLKISRNKSLGECIFKSVASILFSNYKPYIRKPSKIIFNALSAIFITVAASLTFMNLQPTPEDLLDCQDICNLSTEEIKNCNTTLMTFPIEFHIPAFCVVVAFLIASILEGIFENLFYWMPFHKTKSERANLGVIRSCLDNF